MKNNDECDVGVVIVTYNRLACLRITIDSVLTQSHRVSRVYIIDNCSTDGTLEYCLELAKREKRVEYIRSEVNGGGAGGFNRGMSVAHQNGHEWIWLMDDDVAPNVDCLRMLLKWSQVSKCIHPRMIESSGDTYKWARINVWGGVYAFSYPNRCYENRDWMYSNMACFEGMLVHKAIVDEVGFPDERFFIAWDDTLYGVKVSLATNIIVVRDAVMDRMLPRSEKKGVSLYYAVRNRFLMRRLLLECGVAPSIESRILDFLQLTRMIFPYLMRAKHMKIILLALLDGANNRFGKTGRNI